MSSTYSTQAIVLQIKPWQEYDGQACCYTKDYGKLELLVRGWQKFACKLTGHLQPFNLVKLMVINGRHQTYAGAAGCLDSRLHLKNDLDKLQAAGYLINNFERLVKIQEVDTQLFLILETALRLLNLSRSQRLWYEFIVQAALLQILARLGYRPKLNLNGGVIDFSYPLTRPASPAVMVNLRIILSNDLLTAVRQVNKSAGVIKTFNQLTGEMVRLIF